MSARGMQKPLILAAIALLAISCRSGGQNDRAAAGSGSAKEAKHTMSTRYDQPFGNPQLNSFVDAPVKAAGRLAWKAAFNPGNLEIGPRDLYVLDEKRALLDAGDAFFAIGLQERRALGFHRKSNNAFLALGEGAKFYYIHGYQLVRQDFERYNEDAANFFVPGLGQYSVLSALFPDAETFVAGVQNLGNPQHPNSTFEIYERPYPGTARRWSFEFEGTAVRPPFDASGTAFVAHGTALTIIDRQGARTDIDTKSFRPASCSIGPDGLLYMTGVEGTRAVLRACTIAGEMKWEVAAPTADPLQPPVVDEDGVVYLVDQARVTAFQEGKRLWECPLSSPNARATAFRDLRLVVADGARIVCLDESGRAVWTYEDKDGEVFMTAPVTDPAGRVLAASEKSIVVIE
jgi:hypothetical protein